ncbi:MAG: PQQ-like beta-propeller repeat protein [Acidobacteria bacterium]|nr:PQQ-like beta-propeller repeat protein [Acidobacteriota bacterium]MBA3886692.1 PQQ-like beta-propeller repeat protein [Acidobacteriota bacterium]
MRIFTLLTALALTAASAPTMSVEMIVRDGDAMKYWPNWRGPSYQGYVHGTGYPDTWSESQNVLWKVPVPGTGNSSPIVWGERIYMATSYDEGRRKAIVAFNRKDGKKVWETFAPDAPPETPHAKNGHASGTPATDGRRIYAYLGNHGLLALDMDGKQVWHQTVGPFNAFHGTAGSPLLYKDRVIFYQDQRAPGGSFVGAFDAATGKPLWRTERKETVGWGTPIAIRAGDRDEIIVSSMRRVYAYDPDTGRELWTAGGNLVEVIPTPVVADGMVFASSGRAGPTLAIRPGGSGDVTDTHVVWSAAKGSPFIPSTLVHDGILYMVNDMQSIATAYDSKSGEVLWQGRLGEAARESFSVSPVLVDGKVFFTNDQGETFVLKTGREFNLLHVNKLNARTLASPALVDGTWYWRTDRELIAIGQ